MKSRKTGKDFALKVVSKKLKARIAVSELPPDLAHMVMDGSLSLGEAKQIAGSDNPQTQARHTAPMYLAGEISMTQALALSANNDLSPSTIIVGGVYRRKYIVILVQNGLRI